MTKQSDEDVPQRRLVAAALCLNDVHEVLLVKPTYRNSWLLPGGMVEAEESPHAGCGREVREELGLTLACARLLCVDYRSRQKAKVEGVHFLFEGGVLSATQIGAIRLPPEELMAFQFFPLAEAVRRLPAKGGRLLTHALGAWETGQTYYLEEGEPFR
ncbi:MAG: NUDIX hydrolase [Ardenticatenales bacterium]|nr:NUDIX hydrolase [Ardenticatenales bacterium]